MSKGDQITVRLVGCAYIIRGTVMLATDSLISVNEGHVTAILTRDENANCWHMGKIKAEFEVTP
jgi:hypothetical protein